MYSLLVGGGGGSEGGKKDFPREVLGPSGTWRERHPQTAQRRSPPPPSAIQAPSGPSATQKVSEARTFPDCK